MDVMGVTFRYAGLENQLAAPDAGAEALAGQLMAAAHRDSFQIQFVYLGVGSVLLFWLLLKSRFIPRPLAMLGLVASAMLILQAFAHLVFPEQVQALGLGMAEYALIFLAEVGTGLWLLIRGADLRWWNSSGRGKAAPATPVPAKL